MQADIASHQTGVRTIAGTDWPVLDVVQRQQTVRRIRWVVLRGLCNGVPVSSTPHKSLRSALADLGTAPVAVTDIPGIATLHGDHPLALARYVAGHYGSTVRLACPVVIHWTREDAHTGLHFDHNYDCFLSRADADAWLSAGVDGLVAVVAITENPWPPADPDAWASDPSWLGV